MASRTEQERRILRNALYATNAGKACDFGTGERGDIARNMAASGLLEVDHTGVVPGHVYYAITEAGRLAFGDDEEAN